nr:CPBP family intramembrane glutamic endopeptidase [uncultured Hyphomonas sp.]
MTDASPLKKVATWLLWALPLMIPLVLPGIGALFSLVVVVLALIFHKDARRATLRWWGNHPGRMILIGIGAGIVIHIAFSVLIEPLIQTLLNEDIDLSNFDGVKGNIANYLILLAIGIFFGGFAEELMFRGFVVGWGERLFGGGAIFLVVLSAAVFGAAHLYQGPSGMLSTGLVGLLFGLIYLSTGRRLVPCMLAHATIDILGITELYVGHAFLPPLFGA